MNRTEIKTESKAQLRGNWAWAVGLSFTAWLISYLILDLESFMTEGHDRLYDLYIRYQFDRADITYLREPSFVEILIGLIIAILVGLLIWGVAYTMLEFRDTGRKTGILKGIFAAYTNDRFNISFLTYVMMTVFLFLWSLLLFIPAIIKSYSYAMVPYILKDNFDRGQRVSATDAITKSRKMMKGFKLDLFILDLSFLGWFILGFLTLGIGLLWVIPYYRQTKVNFYRKLTEMEK